MNINKISANLVPSLKKLEQHQPDKHVMLVDNCSFCNGEKQKSVFLLLGKSKIRKGYPKTEDKS